MKKLYSILFLVFPLFIYGQTTDLIISKYGEGSSNHKFIEIYNGTGADVDLTNYSLSSCSNGCDTTDEWDYPDNVTFPAGTTIANGDVYVVTHPSADESIASDQTFTYLSNGDDVYALTLSGATASSYTIIDILGDMGGDPGSGWDVAGVTNGTKDHTLTRKTSVCSPNPTPLGSFGTNADDSEWVVTDQNEGWDTVGSYTTACVQVTTESIPWSDDFETGDFSAGWTHTAASGAPTSIWEVSTLQNNTSGGSNSARHNYSSSGTYDSYLVGPTFDLSGATSPVVSYSDYVDWTADADTHSLVYSEDYVDDVDAATWVVLNDVLGSEDTWVANGPYALPTTGTVTIAFRYQGYYAAEWFVDDVTVEEAPTAPSADWDVSPADFSDWATVSMTVENFTIGATGDGYDGHWHYALDGGSTVMVYDTNDLVLTGLSTGDHTLVAWLVDDSHQDLDPAVTETITWTQTDAPGCGETLSYDYPTGSSGGGSFDTNFTSPDAGDLLFTTSVDNAGDEMTVTIGGETESGYDWVYVTDGAGTVLQAPISGTMGDVAVTSTDGTLNVYLASDSSITDGPVTFTFTCQSPAGDPNTVEADPTLSWLGYMNVFENAGGAQGGYLWGSAWGVADLVTVLNTETDEMSITLKPNYNTYADNPGDSYWQDGDYGNKWMQGITYVESATEWNGADLTFTGYVHHHSLAAGWTANFFIKALDPNNGYADALNGAYETALPTDGQFTVTVPHSELSTGFIVQAGFSVNGLNANPENEVANGKVVVSASEDAPMSTGEVDVLDMRIYPNPVDGNFVTILSPVNGTKYIEVFDINGRRVMDTAINNNTLDVSSINSGFYMIKVTVEGQSKISKLVIR